MADHLADQRLRLFAFTQAPEKQRYLAVLRAFDEAREQSRLQLSPADIESLVDQHATTEAALASLDQLEKWGLLDRLQDDRRVRSIAEYRQRRSVYQMTELGWLAWDAVEKVLAAEPGEAELRRMVLPMVLHNLQELLGAVQADEGERVAVLLDSVHRTLSDLAHHAARFTLATSELASTWEADPATFLAHKNRLIGHLHGFLAALSAHRPLLAAEVRRIEAHEERLISLATGASGSLAGSEKAQIRNRRHWEGVVSWFVDLPSRPSQAALLEDRTSRAIRDLAVLLKRVLNTTAGGVSRATQLEDLAAWFIACPDDESAHALASATSGMRGARHFGAPAADVDATDPSCSWWDAPPSPVDTTLRRHGRTTSPPPPKPIPDRRKERRILQLRQAARREADAGASRALVEALGDARILREVELSVLLRLLSRALQTRRPAAGLARTTQGGVRLTVEPADVDTRVSTVRGTLVLPAHRLTVSSSRAQP